MAVSGGDVDGVDLNAEIHLLEVFADSFDIAVCEANAVDIGKYRNASARAVRYGDNSRLHIVDNFLDLVAHAVLHGHKAAEVISL